MWTAAAPGLLVGAFGGGVAASMFAGTGFRLIAGALLGLAIGGAVLRLLQRPLATRGPAEIRFLAVLIGAGAAFTAARALA